MQRPVFAWILAVTAGQLTGVVLLISVGFARKLGREDASLSAETTRLRATADAAQSRLRFSH